MTAPKAIEILPLIFGLLLAVIVIEFPRSMAFFPGVIALITLCVYAVKHKTKPILPKRNTIILIAIAALAAISSLWAINSEYALERSGKLVPVFFAGIVCMSAAYTLPVKAARFVFITLAALIACGALLAGYDLNFDKAAHKFLRGLDTDTHIKDAVFNRGTVVICLSIISVTTYFTYIQRNVKIALAAALPLGLLMLYTDSQSTQLALLVALIFFFAFPVKCKVSWYTLAGLISALILTAPFFTPLLYTQADTINNLPFFGHGMGYAGPRLEIWDYVGRYIQQNPLYGYGIEATRHITDFDSAQKFIEVNTILHPHNFALQLWIEFGVIGALACCAFIFWLFRQMMTIESPHVQRAALASFMAILSISATGYGIWQSWWLGTLLFTAAQITLLKRSAAEK
ncbi:MAG: O-antigen ligase family protein [Alphaproteobacteria bacterium]|nr:O-antigen ligase family protein [Alphaproteobacteria bacterium]